jgi:alkylhydroperoxidase family enzyme
MPETVTSSVPRIAPGGREELGRLNWVLLKLATKRTGGPIPNIMLTLGRHRRMFKPWLWFASRLMPYGTMPAEDSELVILRVGARCGSDYERHHHTNLGKQAGLGEAVIAWTAEPVGSDTPAPDADGISGPRAEVLVRAADELLDTHTLSDVTWSELQSLYNEVQLIEFCMLTGHYAMLAGTLNAAGVQLEPGAGMPKLR